MKIVFLDKDTIGKDIDLSKFSNLGAVVSYGYTNYDEVAERVSDADVVIVNEAIINEETVGRSETLKMVCVPSTGTNNLDKEYIEKKGLQWRNVVGYSTDAVAQHTFALLLYVYEHMSEYDRYVKSEEYIGDVSFSYMKNTFHEIKGKTWGIIGLGTIGKRVAEIAECFGANVIYYSTSGKNHNDRYREVSLEELLKESDIVSIHAPLNDDTRHLINLEKLSMMKKSAVLVNCGRGAQIVEKDLLYALENNIIAAAALDVIDGEPMTETNPLRVLKDSNRLVITPHIAWTAIEARERLMDTVYMQIKEYFNL